MNPLFQKLWSAIKNKYVLTTIIFILIFVIFDTNNVRVTMGLSREVSRLEHQKVELEAGISADSVEIYSLKDNLDAIERYGREHYYMKRENEDLFIIKH